MDPNVDSLACSLVNVPETLRHVCPADMEKEHTPHPVSPVLEKLRQEEKEVKVILDSTEFEAILRYMRPCFENENTKLKYVGAGI